MGLFDLPEVTDIGDNLSEMTRAQAIEVAEKAIRNEAMVACRLIGVGTTNTFEEWRRVVMSYLNSRWNRLGRMSGDPAAQAQAEVVYRWIRSLVNEQWARSMYSSICARIHMTGKRGDARGYAQQTRRGRPRSQHYQEDKPYHTALSVGDAEEDSTQPHTPTWLDYVSPPRPKR